MATVSPQVHASTFLIFGGKYSAVGAFSGDRFFVGGILDGTFWSTYHAEL